MIIDKNEAKKILLNGGNVIIPTETVYGFAASIFHPEAIARIYLMKKRPQKNPLIIHAATMDQVLSLVTHLPEKFFDLANCFWPGPLTFILQGQKNIHPSITGGLETVGIRIPNHPDTLSLIKETGPLAAPSANLSGKPSSTRVSHLEKDFGINIPILQGPPPQHGLESTILGWIEGSWQILRYGCITKEAIETVLGIPILESELPICPGKQFKHYSPEATLFYTHESLPMAEAIIGYKNRNYPTSIPFYSLGEDNDPSMIAYNLFATLRQIDADNHSKVWIDVDLPQEGLYKTIIERILRAMDRSPLLTASS